MSQTVERTIIVHIQEQHYATLDELACRSGRSQGEVLRDAIAHEKWLQDAVARGAVLLIQEHGETREIKLR